MTTSPAPASHAEVRADPLNQISIDVASLAPAVAAASRSVSSRPTRTGDAGIRIITEADKVHVSAVDGESHTRATAVVAQQGTLDVVVPGRLLADICKALPNGIAHIALDDSRLRLTVGRSGFTLPTFPVDSYPHHPAIPASFGFVPGEDLSEAIRATHPAVATKDTIIALTGVHILANPQTHRLTLAATDRYRLAICDVEYLPDPSHSEPTELLVSGKFLEAYKSTSSGPVSLLADREDPKWFGIEQGSTVSCGRLVAGDFPKTDALIPDHHDASITVNAADMATAVKRITTLSHNEPFEMRLDAGAGTIDISVVTPDSEARDEVEFTPIDGSIDKTVAYRFNSAYFLAGLSAVGTDEATVSLHASPIRPVLLQSTGETNNARYLLMPVRGAQ